jgi:hypothetical protein
MNEKKSGSGWGEVEQVGPYQLQEQVPQSEYSGGELYRATHETSGATALVLKPTGDKDGAAPLSDWRVRFISSDSPSYVALEVEHSPKSVDPDKHSVEALMVMFGDVREGTKRMAHAFSDTSEVPPWRRLGLALVSAAAVCALVFALAQLVPMSQPLSDPGTLARTEPALPSHEVPTDTVEPSAEFSHLDLKDGGPLARPMPSKPYKGQRRPPCKPRSEEEINGGCWVPHELKAPCPEDLYEYRGKCYTASAQPAPLPRSIGQ